MALASVGRCVVGIVVVSIALLAISNGWRDESTFHLGAGILLAAAGLNYVARPSVASGAVLEILWGAAIVAFKFVSTSEPGGATAARRAGETIGSWFAVAFGVALLVHGASRLRAARSRQARSALP